MKSNILSKKQIDLIMEKAVLKSGSCEIESDMIEDLITIPHKERVVFWYQDTKHSTHLIEITELLNKKQINFLIER